MSEEQKILISLNPGDRTWIGRYRVTRLQNGSWLFWSKQSQRITIKDTLPEATELAQSLSVRSAA